MEVTTRREGEWGRAAGRNKHNTMPASDYEASGTAPLWQKLRGATPSTRKWGQTVEMAKAVAGAAAVIDEIESEELRSLATRLAFAQSDVAKARKEAPAKDELLAELEHGFRVLKADKTPAVAPLARASRASNRISSASANLDPVLDAFVAKAVQMLKEAEATRLMEVQAYEAQLRDWEDRLGQSAADAEHQRNTLHGERAAERLARLKAALRMVRNWRSAVRTGRAEGDVIIDCFRREIALAEAREVTWREHVRRHEAEILSLQRALDGSEDDARAIAAAFCQKLAAQSERNESAYARLERKRQDEAMKARNVLMNEEHRRKEAEQELEATKARAEAREAELEAELAKWRHYGTAAEHHLRETKEVLLADKAKVQSRADAKLFSERERLEAKVNDLEAEVKRLREVQVEVLQRGGLLPGGEARMYLFYEASKFDGRRAQSCDLEDHRNTAVKGKEKPAWRPSGRQGGGGEGSRSCRTSGAGGSSGRRAAPGERTRAYKSSLLQPGPSISWRGQQESEVALQIDSLGMPLPPSEAKVGYVRANYRGRPNSAR